MPTATTGLAPMALEDDEEEDIALVEVICFADLIFILYINSLMAEFSYTNQFEVGCHIIII